MYNLFPMDPVADIKARLPIEQLVGQYCALKKKGNSFVCLCPFHKDTHPSMQVSPDKGIAYCFACSSGGDIFSFYQKIEGVDFRQALKDLGEKTGVKVEGIRAETPVQKDHKVRIRECLEAACKYYQKKLAENPAALDYIRKRQVPPEQVTEFRLGIAPDSFSDTYQYLLKAGFSRKEIVDASLGIQKDLNDQKIYDRFRNRLMFPIEDGNGDIVGFGGRTLAEDDAKYINSGETSLYNKSTVLYGLSKAKDAIRSTKKVVLVEGYFDVLACHRLGITNAVAVSGTALTEQHVKILKRHAETVVLCLDQDHAGQEAAERAFLLCSEEELPVLAVTLSHKDPDEAAAADPVAFANRMRTTAMSYLDLRIDALKPEDVSTSEGKHVALKTLLPLLKAIKSSVERSHYLARVATLLATTETALAEDISRMKEPVSAPSAPEHPEQAPQQGRFQSAEIALGIIMLFPQLKHLLSELIEPEDPFAACLYRAMNSTEILALPSEYAERASILLLYCEHHGFSDWSEGLAAREVRKNCAVSNREILRKKQVEIAELLRKARDEGNAAEESKLSTQYGQVLKLAKMAVK